MTEKVYFASTNQRDKRSNDIRMRWPAKPPYCLFNLVYIHANDAREFIEPRHRKPDTKTLKINRRRKWGKLPEGKGATLGFLEYATESLYFKYHQSIQRFKGYRTQSMAIVTIGC